MPSDAGLIRYSNYNQLLLICLIILDAVSPAKGSGQDDALVSHLLALSDNDAALSRSLAAQDGVSQLRDIALQYDPTKHSKISAGLMAQEASAVTENILRQTKLAFADVQDQKAAAELLAGNPSFDLATQRVSQLPGIDVQPKQVLESFQRIQNIAAEPETVIPILNAGITSAAQITSVPLATFAALVPQLSPETAEHIYANAVRATNRNQMALAAVAPSIGTEAAPIAAAISQPVAGAVNLDTLFHNSVTTQGPHCSSVLSPSAYLIDLLEFLASVKDSKAQKNLLERRPDIGNLELSCANTNNEIPYIDLVNEILGSYLSTIDSSSEGTIRAYNDSDEPEHSNVEPQNVDDIRAYDALAEQVVPLGTLPFSRGLEESRILFEKLGTSRLEVLRTFGSTATEPVLRATTAEALSLPETEYRALTGEAFNVENNLPIKPNRVHELWGFNTQSDMLDPYQGISRIKSQFLRRTGYSYEDVVELLKTRFINGSVPAQLLAAKDSLENLWKLVKWDQPNSQRDAKWGGLLSFLGMPVDGDPATSVIESFMELPNLVITTPIEASSEVQTATSRKWPLPFPLYYGKEGEPTDSTFIGTIGEDGKINRTENGCLVPVAWIDDRGCFRCCQTYSPPSLNSDLPALYSLPQYQDPNKIFWVGTPYPGNVTVAKLPREDGTNGEVVINSKNITYRIYELGPRMVSPIAGWSFPPLEVKGEPDPALLTLRTFSGQPLSVQQWGRINQFVRLQKRVGWSIAETDRALSAFGAEGVSSAFLEHVATLKRIQHLTGLDLDRVLVFATDIGSSLYMLLFSKKSIIRTDPVFGISSSGVPSFTAPQSSTKISLHYSSIGAGLGMSTVEVSKLAVFLGVQDESLTLSSLSLLYRYVLLCRALGQPLTQLRSLLNVFGKNPFVDIETTFTFLDFWNMVLSRYSAVPSDWEYIMTGEDSFGRLSPATSSVVQAARAIRVSLPDIGLENPQDVLQDSVLSILASNFISIPSDIIALLLRDTVFNPSNLGDGFRGGFFIPPITGQYTIEERPNSSPTTPDGIGESPNSLIDVPIALGVPTDLIGGQNYRLGVGSLQNLTMTVKSRALKVTDVPISGDCLLDARSFSVAKRITTLLSRYTLLFSTIGSTADDIQYLSDYCRLPSPPATLPSEALKTFILYDSMRTSCGSAKVLTTLLRPGLSITLEAAAAKISDAFGWEHPFVLDLLSLQNKADTSAALIKIDVAMLNHLHSAYRLAKKLGMPDVARLQTWANPATAQRENALQLRALARSMVDDATWESTATALFDPLRDASRNALVASCLNVKPELRDANALFEYFLIDVSMGTCLRTSRIKQALSSIQIFVQRCLLGLEVSNGVPSNHIDKNRWEWMGSYDLWQANRRILLYPENWLEPSLRDDKSAVFKVAEDMVNQGNLTMDEIISRYVSELSEVANLEPVALKAGPARDHVFARTRASPHKLFYRSLDRRTCCWTPWEAMDMEIPTLIVQKTFQQTPGYFENRSKFQYGLTKKELAQHMIACPKRPIFSSSYIRPVALGDNDHRLAIFVPTFTERSYVPADAPESGTMKYYWEVGMSFSERKDGKWSARRNAPETVLARSPVGEINTKNWSGGMSGKFVARLPQPKLPDADIDDHLIRYGSFFIIDFQDPKGSTVLWIYLAVPTQPRSIENSNEPFVSDNISLEAAFIGEFVYEGGELHLRRTRTSDEFDEVLYGNRWSADWLFQGRNLVTHEQARRRVVCSTVSVASSSQDGPITVDETPLQLELLKDDSASDKANEMKRLWAKHTLIRPLQGFGSSILAVPLSNNCVDQFQDLVRRDRSRDIFNYFTEGFEWPHAALIPGNLSSPFKRADATTILDQSLGISDRTLKYLWYHELRTPTALYNWELCVHIPMLLANAALAMEQFDQALDAIKLVFDPTAHRAHGETAVWKFLPFKETAEKGSLEVAVLSEFDQAELDDNPFSPYVIARQRCTAYMKWFTYKYIEIMVGKGDVHFRRFTLESISLAIQCYIEAAEIFGPSPQSIMSVGKKKVQTFNSVHNTKEGWVMGSTGRNALVDMETLFPFRIDSAVVASNRVPKVSVFGTTTANYFHVPANPALGDLKARIDDRLFKIRHCQDINGNTRSLALWEPPLDPGSLIRALATGKSLGSAIDSVSAVLPDYRFRLLLRSAFELCGELKTLGKRILKLRRRKDVELLSALRSTQAQTVTKYMKEIAEEGLEVEKKALEVIKGNREASVAKMKYYLQLLGEDEGVIPKEPKDPEHPEEEDALKELSYNIYKPSDLGGLPISPTEAAVTTGFTAAAGFRAGIMGLHLAVGVLRSIPDSFIASAPLGVGLISQVTPQTVHAGLNATALALGETADMTDALTGLLQFCSELEKQTRDRKLEANMCGQDIAGFDQQIAEQIARVKRATTRINMQQAEFEQHEEMDRFLRTKYTNAELYTWTINSLQQIYYKLYNQALDVAGQAERAFCYERGLTGSDLIKGGCWNESYDGLLAGEQLSLALHRLEAAHHASRAHDFEILRSVSLRQIGPLALVSLRSVGRTDAFDLPEVLWDIDFPGHYNRRIRSVKVTILCDASPHTTMNATLSLLKHKCRVKPIVGGDYAETESGDDRFVTYSVPTTSVAVCTGQNDAGVFELDFHGERYAPFEGAGLIRYVPSHPTPMLHKLTTTSRWSLGFASEIRSFDYSTISDVILDIQYTSQRADTGGLLTQAASKHAINYLKIASTVSLDRGLGILVDPRAEFPTEWDLFCSTGTMRLRGARLRAGLPFFARAAHCYVGRVRMVAEFEEGMDPELKLAIGEGPALEFDLGSQVVAIGDRKIGTVERELEEGGVQWSTRRAVEDWVVNARNASGMKGIAWFLLIIGYSMEL